MNAAVSFSLAFISLVATCVWMPESFRFLYGKKRFEEARVVLAKAAKFNKADFDFINSKFEAEQPSTDFSETEKVILAEK